MEQGTVTEIERLQKKREYLSDESSSKGLKVTFKDNNFDEDDIDDDDDDTERMASIEMSSDRLGHQRS